jgi:hypothetical protein
MVDSSMSADLPDIKRAKLSAEELTEMAVAFTRFIGEHRPIFDRLPLGIGSLEAILYVCAELIRDETKLERHESIRDLMRSAAMNCEVAAFAYYASHK